MWISKNNLHEMIMARVRLEVARQVRNEVDPTIAGIKKWKAEADKNYESIENDINKWTKEQDERYSEFNKRSEDWRKESNESNSAHHKLLEGWLKEIKDHIIGVKR